MVSKSRTLHKFARIIPLVLAVLSSVFLYSCESNGIVGPKIVPKTGKVVVDTIPLNDFQTSKLDLFSGQLTNYSAGMYNDKLFGDLKATGLIQPSLLGSSGIDTINSTTKAFLRINISAVYGDTNSTVNFDLVEADKRWRGQSWRLDSIPPASNQIITSFSVPRIDSLDIPLPQSWIMKYRTFYYDSASVRDSLYNQSEPGFILVPKSGNRIISINGANTRVIFETKKDTVPAYANTWAYSLSRTNVPQQPDSLSQIYSTFENVPSATINVSSNDTLTIDGTKVGTKALSRVELAFYEDSTAMKSSLPANNTRPAIPGMYVYYVEKGQQIFDILKGPIANGVANYDTTDSSYRLNLTSQISNIMLGQSNTGRFYFVPGANDGTIYSLLIKTEKAKKRFPKLIVTSVKP